jgi:hypothetical protein
MKRFTFLLLTALLILSLAVGCSSRSASGNETAAADQSYNREGGSADNNKGEAFTAGEAPAAPAPSAAPAADSGQAGALVPDVNRKMIWTGNIELETTDFDSSVRYLYDLIDDCKGFIQSSAVTGEGRTAGGESRLRNARYTVRVPGENFQLFMKSSGNVATLISSSTKADDVTSYYFDTEARVKVLKVKEERLLSMLEKADQTEYKDELQYILQIENELSNVRYEIENLTGTLRKYDDLISYSTVEVYIEEVEELKATPAKPESVGQRISERFTASVRGIVKAAGDFIAWLIGYSPILIVFAVFAAIIYAVYRFVFLRGKKRAVRAPSDEDKKQ